MVKIFKEESSNEEKENNQSDLYSCDFSSVDSNMSSSFFVNDFDFIYEGKGCSAERANFISEFSTLSGKLCKSVDCKPFSDVLFQHTIRVCSGPYRKSVNFDHDGIFFLTIPVSRKGAYLLLLTMMIPAQLAMISQYTVLNGLKLIDTYKGIWLLWGGTCVAGNTFFYRGFFEAVPKELEESMYLDGATRFQTLLHCIIPLSKPAIATQAVLAFNGYWSNLFDILTFTKSTNKRTLSVAPQLFRGQYTTNYGLMFAASVIVIIPIIVLFVIFQKQFMQQGITDGSIKG